jgi:hypothetical protein
MAHRYLQAEGALFKTKKRGVAENITHRTEDSFGAKNIITS